MHKEIEIRCKANKILPLLFVLKKHTYFQYQSLMDIAVYDQPGKLKRFTVVYILNSTFFNSRLNIRTQIGELEFLKSVVSVFSNAN